MLILLAIGKVLACVALVCLIGAVVLGVAVSCRALSLYDGEG